MDSLNSYSHYSLFNYQVSNQEQSSKTWGKSLRMAVSLEPNILSFLLERELKIQKIPGRIFNSEDALHIGDRITGSDTYHVGKGIVALWSILTTYSSLNIEPLVKYNRTVDEVDVFTDLLLEYCTTKVSADILEIAMKNKRFSEIVKASFAVIKHLSVHPEKYIVDYKVVSELILRCEAIQNLEDSKIVPICIFIGLLEEIETNSIKPGFEVKFSE